MAGLRGTGHHTSVDRCGALPPSAPRTAPARAHPDSRRRIARLATPHLSPSAAWPRHGPRQYPDSRSRRRGRMVRGSGLENRRGLIPNGRSIPTLSATSRLHLTPGGTTNDQLTPAATGHESWGTCWPASRGRTRSRIAKTPQPTLTLLAMTAAVTAPGNPPLATGGAPRAPIATRPS